MTETLMRREINEIPEAVARLLDQTGIAIRDAGAALAKKDPAFLCTIARGSSDHASLFLKYAIELTTGRAVASLGPSLASIYNVKLSLGQAAVFSVSQSGQSPDIISLVKSAGEAGGLTVALTNTPSSPLWNESHVKIDIAAGPELAVAATKSYVNSAVAGLAILAEWTGNADLKKAVDALPQHFAKALELDWQALFPALEKAESLFVLGRGPTLAIASEAALKFKETADYHAEAYSSAEVLHGPVALVDRTFPVLAFAARDAAEDSIATIAEGIAGKGAPTFLTSDKASASTKLPFVSTGHPITDALCLIVPFYGFVEALSRRRGYNPDKPAALSKVTKTQ